MSVYISIDVPHKNFYKNTAHPHAWITIYQEKVKRNEWEHLVDINHLKTWARGAWLFDKLSNYSDILLQLSDIVNGIERNEQLALLYVNHDVDVIRQIAGAILKYGPKGVNITYLANTRVRDVSIESILAGPYAPRLKDNI
jgi:hypothetical protein